jgi:hypothetical protein
MRVDCDIVLQPTLSKQALSKVIYVPTLREVSTAILYIDAVSFSGGDATSKVHSLNFSIVCPSSFKSTELNWNMRFPVQAAQTEDSQAFMLQREGGGAGSPDHLQIQAEVGDYEGTPFNKIYVYAHFVY